MKAKRPHTPETTMNNLGTIDMDKKAPLSVKACDMFGPSCSFASKTFCIPHPKSQTGQRKIGLGHENMQKGNRGN